MLSGLLALAGISGENMVRDAGWYMLDIGRGLERALQVVALLQATLGGVREPDTERMMIEAVLTAAESIVTFRRRYRGRTTVEAAARAPGAGSAQSRARWPTSWTGSALICGPSRTPRRRRGRSGWPTRPHERSGNSTRSPWRPSAGTPGSS